MKTTIRHLILALAALQSVASVARAQQFQHGRGPTSRQILGMLAKDACLRAYDAHLRGDEAAARRFLGQSEATLRIAANIPADAPGEVIVGELQQRALQNWYHAQGSQNSSQIAQATSALGWTNDLARQFEHTRTTGAPFQVPNAFGPVSAPMKFAPPSVPNLAPVTPMPFAQPQTPPHLGGNPPVHPFFNDPGAGTIASGMRLAESIFKGDVPVVTHSGVQYMFDNGRWYRIPNISDDAVRKHREQEERKRQSFSNPGSSLTFPY